MVAEAQMGPDLESDPQIKILVADDDHGSRETLAGLLADRGYCTVEAASGEEVIDIVQVETIHLVFLDMHMPRMTGLEALEHVRMLNQILPAILMTADATQELIRQAFQAQVFSVIPKPVNKNILLHTFYRALQRAYGIGPDENTEQPPTKGTE